MKERVKISVIIPTYNRLQVLKKCLFALQEQKIESGEFEVVIIDDGSTDGTLGHMNSTTDNRYLNLKFFRQDHKGPAAARNQGIKRSEGDLVLFIGDDIIAIPALLAEHINWHKENADDNIAVLGYVTWSPEIKITPFMRWLENGGPQFKFWAIHDPNNVPWQHLITANISFKRKFLLENGLFDEDFPYAAYEDTELGHRLNKKGLSIVFNKEAIGYHYHPTSLDDAMARMKHIAVSRRIFSGKSCELAGCKNRLKRNRLWRNLSLVKFYFAKQIGYLAESRWTMPSLYSYILDKAKYIVLGE